MALFAAPALLPGAPVAVGDAAARVSCDSSTIPPAADFTWTPANPTTSDFIRGIDQSQDPDGAIVAWDWRGPLGGGSLQRTPGKQIADPGTYAVTLTVTDNECATDSITKDITVLPTPPVAAFDWEVLSESGVPTTNDFIQFKDRSRDPDGRVVGWTWTPEGGQQSFRSTMSHRFPAPGTYNVTLVASDNHGATATAVRMITVEQGPREQVAILHTPSQPTPNTPVFLRAVPDLPRGVEIESWTWVISDGTASRAREPVHIFKQVGPYQVRLTAVLTTGAIVEAEKEIRVDPGLPVQGDAVPPPAKLVAPLVLTVAIVAALLLIRTRNRIGP